MSSVIVKEIEYEDVSKYFEYSEDSPSCLIRKFCRNNKSKEGKPCGKLNKYGYWVVSYRGKSFSVARIIYCIVHKSITTDKVIDHIDQNKSNNLKENLRLVSIGENNKNKPKPKSNKTSVTGVMYIKIANRVGGFNEYYRSVFSTKSKAIVKSFNIKTYGKELAFKLASEHRDQMINSDPSYSERHGK